jgi:uncharacterized protein (DUF2384 family)
MNIAKTTSKTELTTTAKRSAVALKSFLGIAYKWKLSGEQQQVLLGVPRATFYRWKQHPSVVLSVDTIERISYILGIYKALRILLPSEDAANQWIHKPNSAFIFGGHSALDKMLKGHVVDLADVRRYLDAQRG